MLTGVRVATEEEYAERTKKDQEALLSEEAPLLEASEIQSMYVFEGSEEDAVDGSWAYMLGDGSVLYTYVEGAAEAADMPEDGPAKEKLQNVTGEAVEQSEDQAVPGEAEIPELHIEIEENAAEDQAVPGEAEIPELHIEIEENAAGEAVGSIAERDGSAQGTETERDNSSETDLDADSSESTIAYETGGGFEYDADFQKLEEEYEAAGIAYDSRQGAWLWEGKMIYWLMDDNGNMYQNTAKEAKENKIYVLVKRNTDGTIKEAKRVTMEDLMLFQMQKEE